MHVALDDFGTGYSSLARLNGLPLDAVKTDRRLLGDGAATSKLAPAVIDLAHAVDLRVVAEGVETQDSWDWLADSIRT